jgi:transporter family-2 protein
VGSVLNNAPVANALFWCVGAATAVAIGLTGWHAGALAGLKDVHPLYLAAGAMGATLVFAIAWLIPQVGPANFFIILLTGQVITGLVLSHKGWLGPQSPVTPMQAIGAVVMLVGLYLTQKA